MKTVERLVSVEEQAAEIGAVVVVVAYFVAVFAVVYFEADLIVERVDRGPLIFSASASAE